MRTLSAALAALGLLAGPGSALALDLHAARSSPFDLEVSGRISGVPAGQARYASWQDIRALPTSRVTLNGEFTSGDQVLTVVFLDELLRALPADAGADTLLAKCSDGYASVYTRDFIAQYRPFLVLEIDGRGPRDWPPPGLDYNPGPFVITVSSALAPAAAKYRDIDHKKPWGVAAIELANFAERYRGLYTGARANLSAAASDGRDIWINSCACCHPGPAGAFGGTKANRPFQVIAAYAGYDRPFFTQYVRKPKSLVPCAKMEPHPDYSDAELSHLIEFITADPR
jgi:cytochrome c2